MKKKYLIYILLLINLACGGNSLPQGILNEDEFVEVLIDIHLAEGLVSTLPINFDSAKTLYPYLEKVVFENHGIPDSVFIKSLEYYLLDPIKMERIYSRTVDSLNVQEKL